MTQSLEALGSHCGGQAKVRRHSVGQVLEPAELTTFVNLFATLSFGTCGLLLLVVNGLSLSEQRPNVSEPEPLQGQPDCSKVSRGLRYRARRWPGSRLTQVGHQVGHPGVEATEI